MEGKKPRTVQFESGYPRNQAALLRQAGLYRSGQKTSLAARGTAMMIRKQYSTKPGRRKEQRDFGSTEKNDDHTEETQHGPSQRPPNIGFGQENEKKLNKQIRWSQEEMKEVFWCFMYVKEEMLGENYKEAYNYGERRTQ
jgi:hypothetical protein